MSDQQSQPVYYSVNAEGANVSIARTKNGRWRVNLAAYTNWGDDPLPLSPRKARIVAEALTKAAFIAEGNKGR